VDAGQVPVPLKGYARVGATGIIGAFNALEDGGAVNGVVRARDVEGLKGERFRVYEHFSQRLVVADPNQAIPRNSALTRRRCLSWCPSKRDSRLSV